GGRPEGLRYVLAFQAGGRPEGLRYVLAFQAGGRPEGPRTCFAVQAGGRPEGLRYVVRVSVVEPAKAGHYEDRGGPVRRLMISIRPRTVGLSGVSYSTSKIASHAWQWTVTVRPSLVALMCMV